MELFAGCFKTYAYVKMYIRFSLIGILSLVVIFLTFFV